MHPADSLIRQQILESRLTSRRLSHNERHDQPFLPVDRRALMWDERLTFTLYVKVTTELEGEITYKPFAAEGKRLESVWLTALQRTGITNLYFHEQDTPKIIAYFNNHLLLQSEKPADTQTKFITLREHLKYSLIQAVQSPQMGRQVHLARNTVGNLFQVVEKNRLPWEFIWEMLYQDYTLYNHSLNVCILGMGMGLFLNKTRKECLILGMAGLFHDVGLTRLDEGQLSKKEPLSPEEWHLLKKHPSLGYELLKDNWAMPLPALRLVLEHHENAEGSGYPQGLPLSQQHPFTRILHLLEAYDGLTTFRPYRAAHSPFAALKILQEEKGLQGELYDRHTLSALIRFLSMS